MNTTSESITLDSIIRQLPHALREAPTERQLAYISRKRGQFVLLSWLGLIMGVVILALTVLTFILPEMDPMDNILMSIVIIAAFAGAAFGNRSMARRYAEFEARLQQETEKQ